MTFFSVYLGLAPAVGHHCLYMDPKLANFSETENQPKPNRNSSLATETGGVVNHGYPKVLTLETKSSSLYFKETGKKQRTIHYIEQKKI